VRRPIGGADALRLALFWGRRAWAEGVGRAKDMLAHLCFAGLKACSGAGVCVCLRQSVLGSGASMAS
jgi:hypothetical protein